MSQPNAKAEQKNEEPTPLEPPPGSWAAVARMMAQSEDPDDPSGIDWDEWKDQMKDEEMGL